MNQQLKLGLIILALLALMGFGSAFFFYQTNQKNVQEFQARERQVRQIIETLQEENRASTEREQSLTDTVKNLEERLAIAGQDLDQIKRELGQAKDELAAAVSQANTLRSERQSLTGQVERLSALKDELERSVAQLRTEKSAVEKTAMALKQQLAKVETENKKLREQPIAPPLAALPFPEPAASAALPTTGSAVSLPPIIVQSGGQPSGAGGSGAAWPPSSAAPVPLRRGRIEGRVVTVNPEYEFIVVDKGAADGIRVGDQFAIARAQRALGTVTVIRVRDTIAACDTKTLGAQVRPRVGDVAALQGAE